MPGWRTVESGLAVGEYAKRVCNEIGWPYSGNLTLLCDCISSLAFSRGVDAWGGFIILMEAVELAKQREVRIDRWFFQDGRYNEILPASLPPAKRATPAAAPPASESLDLLRKPN